jgi:hypothetical protein
MSYSRKGCSVVWLAQLNHQNLNNLNLILKILQKAIDCEVKVIAGTPNQRDADFVCGALIGRAVVAYKKPHHIELFSHTHTKLAQMCSVSTSCLAAVHWGQGYEPLVSHPIRHIHSKYTQEV